MAGISDQALKSKYAENKYRFNKGTELQNKEFVDGSGLEVYETNFRSYDQQVGRFLQIDPLVDVSKNLSPYLYGSDNPTLRNDPSGLKDTIINGEPVQRDHDLNAATVTAKKRKHLPKTDNNQDPDPPYSEITSIALDRTMEKFEKIRHLREITSGATDPIASRTIDAALLKTSLSGMVL